MGAKTTRIEVNGGKDWIEVEQVGVSRELRGEGRTYRIVANSMTEPGDPYHKSTNLGFIPGDGAESVDLDSDPWQCFGISTHVKVGPVSFREAYCECDHVIIKAPSVKAIKSAIPCIEFVAYCPGDI